VIAGFLAVARRGHPVNGRDLTVLRASVYAAWGQLGLVLTLITAAG
jgi:hypothetical protein